MQAFVQSQADRPLSLLLLECNDVVVKREWQLYCREVT